LRSDEVKKGFEEHHIDLLLRATGLKDEDFNKPFIGVANSFIELFQDTFS
jgi:dihydroxy-acid dehydratase